MSLGADDLRFLARLARGGLLDEERARRLADEADDGDALDRLLARELDGGAARVEELRLTGGAPPPAIPGYRFEEPLGVGGTAVVWRAHDERGGRDLALKVLTEEAAADAATVRAFARESKLLGELDHPGLVRCFGAARAGATVFTRLELIDGPSLQDALDGGRRFDEDEALRIVVDVARTLAHLEEKGIVHRDVKPGNVLIDSDGRVVLIDLGFAAAAGAARDDGRDDVATGTVAYLSPEQARGGAGADIRSDVYSLGVTLFQLVVGRLPFEADDDREVLAMQVLASLESKELKQRGVSVHLHYLVQKMMSKDPGERFQSWSELIRDVEELRAGSHGLDWRGSAPASAPRRSTKRSTNPRRRRRR